MAQERILSCKSFANIKLFDARGKDLNDNLTTIAASNNIELGEKETDVFRFVIYSKLNDNARNWLGDRFFSIANTKDLISAIQEYGNTSLETYQVHCPACLSGGKFACSSASCKRAVLDHGDQKTTPIIEVHHKKTLHQQVPAAQNGASPKRSENPATDSNTPKVATPEVAFSKPKNVCQTKSLDNQIHPFDCRSHSPEDVVKQSIITVDLVKVPLEDDPLEDKEQTIREYGLFKHTHRNASEILQAARIGLCFDCNQSWTLGHSCPGRRRDLHALKCMDCKLPQKPGHICPVWRVREGGEFFRQELAYEIMISAMIYECFDCKKPLENHSCKNRPSSASRDEIRHPQQCPVCKLPSRPRHVCVVKLEEYRARTSKVRKILILTAFYGKCFDCKQDFSPEHSCINRIRDGIEGLCPDCKLQSEPNHACDVAKARRFGISDRDSKLKAQLQKRINALTAHDEYGRNQVLPLREPVSDQVRYERKSTSLNVTPLHSPQPIRSRPSLRIEEQQGTAETKQAPKPTSLRKAHPYLREAESKEKVMKRASSLDSYKLPSKATGFRPSSATSNSAAAVDKRRSLLSKDASAFTRPPSTEHSGLVLELDGFGDIRAMSLPLNVQTQERERSSSPDISLVEPSIKRRKVDGTEKNLHSSQREDPLKLRSLLDSAKDCRCWDCKDYWNVRHSCSRRERDRKAGLCVHCKHGLVRGESHDCKVLPLLQESMKKREQLIEDEKAKQRAREEMLRLAEKEKLRVEDGKVKRAEEERLSTLEEEKNRAKQAEKDEEQKRREDELYRWSEMSKIKCSVCKSDLAPNHQCVIFIDSDTGSDVSLTPEEDLYPRQ
jgi:hypothetical protein